MPGPGLSEGPENYTVEDAIQFASLTRMNNYVLYSTACLLVYEVITSLDDEVARVWTLNWRLPKLLFMLNRYVIRIVLVCLWILMNDLGASPDFCRIYSYLQMIPLRLAILTTQALVAIRVWAIYNNSRRMFWVLAILYCVVAINDTQGMAQPAPLGCGLFSMSGDLVFRYSSGLWFSPVCFEFTVVLITVAKLFPQWRWGGKNGLLGSGGNPTLDVLARDSLVYFVLIFACTLASAISYEVSYTVNYRSFLMGPTSAISCIAVSRMMINIGSAQSTSSPHDCPSSADVISDLRFADP
ncbi:hypothetical protein B0H14DRAFT_2681443 [Mycena olivaceomarginata]|nr:hypothetical protein B0H14DRAFT_2681443 [Mycena olivaceomarginata]